MAAQDAYARRPPAGCLSPRRVEPVPGKRKVPKCQARQVQHLGAERRGDALAIMIHSARRRRTKTTPAGRTRRLLLFGPRLNVNFIKRNYKLVCQSVGRSRLRLGSGTGRWQHFRETARKIPGSHIIKRARNSHAQQ